MAITGSDKETDRTDTTTGSAGFFRSNSSNFSHRIFRPERPAKERLEQWLCLASGSHPSLREGFFKLIITLIKKNPELANFVSPTLNVNALELAVKLKQINAQKILAEDLNCKIRPEKEPELIQQNQNTYQYRSPTPRPGRF